MSRNKGGRAKTQPVATAPRPVTEGERKLVEGSRAAILETGISADYFAEHFRLAKVLDKVESRAVEWMYAVGGYEATLSDAVGYYTDARGSRIDIHSVKSALIKAHDITQTIPRARALRILRGCIGRHGEGLIIFRSLELNGEARLYLTARELKEGKDPIGELSSGGRKKRREGGREEGEEDEFLIFKVGYVDLETGRCRVVVGGVTG